MFGIESSIVKIFGQIAGIGGLSLLVFAWLFREVIRKRIFPELTREQAFHIIRLFMMLVFFIGLTGIGAWVYVKPNHDNPPEVFNPPKEGITPVINEWIALTDGGFYLEAWQSLAKPFQEKFSAVDFVNLLTAQRSPKGKVISRTFYGADSVTNLQGYPNGAYATRSFKTQYQDGSLLIENITVLGTKDGWKVALDNYVPVPVPASTSN